MLETQIKNKNYIAHVRESDGEIQSLEDHLLEVSVIASEYAKKFLMPQCGQLIGLLHDFGKYSLQFQNYIKSGTGILDPDKDSEYVDAIKLKGQIDHSTAGAQYIWQKFKNEFGSGGEIVGQILALCIASHHSGLIDCLDIEGEDRFIKRMGKLNEFTNFNECMEKANPEIKKIADSLCTKVTIEEIRKLLISLNNSTNSEIVRDFWAGLLTKFLFSCLIDADRQNSSDFEFTYQKKARKEFRPSWESAISLIEDFYTNNKPSKQIDFIRADIAETCKQKAKSKKGIYTLTVPTGGGKTFASLRFALHHANLHKISKIIYVVPFTTIIEQNANKIRELLEKEGDFKWVLENHSNLEPEKQTWRSKLQTEDWDAPIIMTTMVQFLETIFSGGTRYVRRMHQLANAIIIFDEIQSLPIKTTHLFCNSINYIAKFTGSTVVLCTATQPLLNSLKEKQYGQIELTEGSEIIPNKSDLFNKLKRTTIINLYRNEGWSLQDLTELILLKVNEKGNCLIVVNTKEWALKLFNSCSEFKSETAIYHLSTHQCAAHRKDIFKEIIGSLTNKSPLICISTQLIEAGVDIDFNCVIRFCAGLDSIAQAAGRCNRNGLLPNSEVYIVNPTNENLSRLEDIKIGRDQTIRLLGEYPTEKLLDPEVMSEYYKYYFYNRASEMVYPIRKDIFGREENILNLLSNNRFVCNSKKLSLKQSFKTAGDQFKTINAPTRSLIVPYKRGAEIIIEICGLNLKFEMSKYYKLMKEAQQYSVNVFPLVWTKLGELGVVHETVEGEGVFYLEKEFYNKNFGLFLESKDIPDLLICG